LSKKRGVRLFGARKGQQRHPVSGAWECGWEGRCAGKLLMREGSRHWYDTW